MTERFRKALQWRKTREECCQPLIAALVEKLQKQQPGVYLEISRGRSNLAYTRLSFKASSPTLQALIVRTARADGWAITCGDAIELERVFCPEMVLSLLSALLSSRE